MSTQLRLVLLTGWLVTWNASATALPPQLKLIAGDGAPNDEFGGDVAIDNTTAVVGARFDDDAGSLSGSAYVFNALNGQQLAKLTANDAAADDWFGISVGIDGSTVIVGSYQDDDRGLNSGSAYLFNATTGTQLRKLTASDGAPGDGFGNDVDLSGTTAIVGSYLDDNKGSAYVFNTTSGQRLHKFAPSDLSTQAYFGGSASISGNIAIVGANADDATGNASGSAYLFDVTTGNKLFKLTPNDGQSGLQFGISVDIDGSNAIVGTVDGAAYLFDAVTGVQRFKLRPADLVGGEFFGISVAIRGQIAIVGAVFDNDRGQASGSAYVFDVGTGQQVMKMTAFDGVAFDQFGGAVGLSGSKALVGAWHDDDRGDNSGAAYLISVPEPCTAMLWLSACIGFQCGLTRQRRRRRGQ